MLLPLWWDMSSPCLEGMISDEQKLVDSLIAPWNLPIYHLKILMLGQINIIWKSMVENLLMKKNVPFTVRGTFPSVNFHSSTVSRSPGKKVAEVEGVLGVHMACSNEWNSFSGFLDVKKDEESLKQKHVWCFCWGRGEMDGWSLRKMVIIYKYDGVEWLMFGPHKLICLRIFVGDFVEFLVNWYHVDVFVGVEEGGKKVGLLEPCGFLEVLLDVCSNWECFTRKSCQHEACFRGQFGDTPWN